MKYAMIECRNTCEQQKKIFVKDVFSRIKNTCCYNGSHLKVWIVGERWIMKVLDESLQASLQEIRENEELVQEMLDLKADKLKSL